MDHLDRTEDAYRDFMSHLAEHLPEGVIEIDLTFLHAHGLLNLEGRATPEEGLTRYFHVYESAEKITLVNDQFIIWIIPDSKSKSTITYALIALKRHGQTHVGTRLFYVGYL